MKLICEIVFSLVYTCTQIFQAIYFIYMNQSGPFFQTALKREFKFKHGHFKKDAKHILKQ